MDYSQMQQQIITTDKSKVLVSCAAASGKTATLIGRLQYLLDRGVSPSKIVAITFTNNAASVMYERLGYPNGLFIGTIHSYCNYLLRGGAVDTTKIIQEERFDDLFPEIEEHPDCLQHIEHLLVDEAQDCTKQQFEFFELINPDNYMYFYDYRQCQPKGTKILMADLTEKNIEDVKIGDQIIAYSKYGGIQGGLAHNAKKIYVGGIESHLNTEEIVTITSENGVQSSYTAGHICLANLCHYEKYNYLTYLMCDKHGRFRVGTSQFRNSNNVPWRAKMNAEECTKIWILDIFKTNKESRVLEDKVSYKYQIPQVTFQLDKTSYSQEDIDYIYDGLNTYENAKRCLNDFHRNINYPFSQVNDNIHYAGNSYNKVYACNLLPQVMDIKIFDETQKHRCRPERIVDVSYKDYPKEVYSLDIPELHTYIADKIVTHNCIYGFNGADPTYLINKERDLEVSVYRMSQNYRNLPNILFFAKKFLYRLGPSYEDDSVSIRKSTSGLQQVVDGNYTPQDAVDTLISANNMLGTNWSDWFVLCRTNLDINLFQKLFAEKDVPTDTFRQADLSNSEIEKKLKENTVKILTVHSAKGLEAPCVLAYNIRAYNDEEARLCYVAATRARDCLIWAKMPPKKKRRKKDIIFWE